MEVNELQLYHWLLLCGKMTLRTEIILLNQINISPAIPFISSLAFKGWLFNIWYSQGKFHPYVWLDNYTHLISRVWDTTVHMAELKG